MGAHAIVVLPPVLDHHLRFQPVPEPLNSKAFVSELAVEAFRRRVLPRLTGIDQGTLDSLLHHPLQQCGAGELRSDVTPQAPRTLISRERPSMTRPERTDSATSIASASRVYASTTVRHFNC